ncbi:hypothetical protein ABZ863_02530 [Saccharomonospora sp. NPDC046836]|uniref:hypothetical protein n=1 Tax=Saccharomonospora sp. NPDC046836 TaxID=3156921 RepID=UPI0033DCADCA
MTWQERLRRLDAELAAGTISHDQHRRRREDILAEASGSPLVSPPATPHDNPDGAPRWQAANPAASAQLNPQPSAQAAVPPSQQPTTPALPQKVNPAALLATSRPTTAPSPADTELTMPISRLHVPPPPIPAENRGRTRTWLLISLGVFLALAAIIGGAWWLGRGDTTDPAPGQETSTQQDVALEDRLPVLPGQPNPQNSTVAVRRGADLGLYTEQTAALLTRNGAQEVLYRASADGPTAYFLLAIPMASPDAARNTAQQMRDSALGAGYTRSSAPDDTLTGELGERTLAGTWYASGDVAVNLWVSQPLPATAADLSEPLTAVVAELRRVLPPA